MTPIERFSIEQEADPHAGVYRSRLFVDGIRTKLCVPGRRMVFQFTTDRGHVLVTDFDTPLEETTSVILVNHDLRPLSWRSFGLIWEFLPSHDTDFSAVAVEWDNPDVFRLLGTDPTRVFEFAIRTFAIPYVRPRLAMRRRSLPHADRRAAESPDPD